jgi:hypothetical protein
MDEIKWSSITDFQDKNLYRILLTVLFVSRQSFFWIRSNLHLIEKSENDGSLAKFTTLYGCHSKADFWHHFAAVLVFLKFSSSKEDIEDFLRRDIRFLRKKHHHCVSYDQNCAYKIKKLSNESKFYLFCNSISVESECPVSNAKLFVKFSGKSLW